MVVLSARPKERRLAEGVRSNLYKGVSSLLPELSLLQVDDAYFGLPRDVAPLVTTMGMSKDVPLVDSAFRKVEEGSVLSYQLPARRPPKTHPHEDAPAPPPLPLEGYYLEPLGCSFVNCEQTQLHMNSLATSLEMAHKIEHSTREQISSRAWQHLRQQRITSSRFREVCHVKGQSSAESLARRILGGSHQTAEMKRGLEMEPAAVEEYCQLMEVNHYPCGFLIHPNAPWLGSSPDGIIYDPKEQPAFSLLEIKCPNVQSYVDCPYLKLVNGTLALQKSHAYYWQVQGQLLISGCEWCDFVVYSQDDMFIQRIPRDGEVMKTIKENADHFFYYFYLQKYLS